MLGSARKKWGTSSTHPIAPRRIIWYNTLRRGLKDRNHLDAGEGLRVSGGNDFPPLAIKGDRAMNGNRNKLSVFVDESGSFLFPDSDSRFYIIGMVFHNQSVDIAPQLKEMDRTIEEIGMDAKTFVFHAGPLIRREQGYEFMNRRLRERIFARMMTFARKVDFRYKCISADKRYANGSAQLADKLKAELETFIATHKPMFERIDSVKIYYDCGQSIITNMLHEVFNELPLCNVEFAQDVRPAKYRLFQLADLVCTLNLISLKLDSGITMSRSESKFFGGPKAFRHNILRRIKSKELP